MKTVQDRTAYALAAFAVLAMATQAHADKGIVTIKSTIKPSSGNDPGTGKEIAKLMLFNPPTGPSAPNSLTMNFDISVEGSDLAGKSDNIVHFKLAGIGKPRRGKQTVWRIGRIVGGMALWVDGKQVGHVASPLLVHPRKMSITVESSPFDLAVNPYGVWHVVFSDGGDSRIEPPVVLVPNMPPTPIPVPKPPIDG